MLTPKNIEVDKLNNEILDAHFLDGSVRTYHSADSIDAATRWYESASYSAARPIRQAASEGSMYLVEG